MNTVQVGLSLQLEYIIHYGDKTMLALKRYQLGIPLEKNCSVSLFVCKRLQSNIPSIQRMKLKSIYKNPACVINSLVK